MTTRMRSALVLVTVLVAPRRLQRRRGRRDRYSGDGFTDDPGVRPADVAVGARGRWR